MDQELMLDRLYGLMETWDKNIYTIDMPADIRLMAEKIDSAIADLYQAVGGSEGWGGTKYGPAMRIEGLGGIVDRELKTLDQWLYEEGILDEVNAIVIPFTPDRIVPA